MNKITQQHIDELLAKAEVAVSTEFGKTTIVTVKLPNGFTITEVSSCVDPANYDPEIGKKYALKRIEQKLWELEGYRLQCELARPAVKLKRYKSDVNGEYHARLVAENGNNLWRTSEGYNDIRDRNRAVEILTDAGLRITEE